MRFKVLDPYVVERQQPVNFNLENYTLFNREWNKSFEHVNGYTYPFSWVDSGGIVANIIFIIQGSSLVNPRAQKSLAFLTGHYPRLLLKVPRIKWSDYLWISERWSHGYFHWLCDALPRYYILPENLRRNTILLPSHYGEYRYIPESLEYLGLKYELIPRKTKFLTKSISFSEPVCKTGNFYPPVMKTIREVFHAKNPPLPYAKRYYISRKFAKVRRILNETECEEVMQDFGFETIYLEKMAFASQMVLMAGADVLMGVHGAGLTNMIACPEHCRIVEIRGETDETNNCFFSLANALDLDYFYLLGREHPTSADKVGDVYVDPIKLAAFLSEYFSIQ